MEENEKYSQDDFLQIKGIGEVTAQALSKLGIKTYQELASFSTAELVKLLKGKISDLTLRRIEKDNWPDQARSLMKDTLSKESQSDSEPPHGETWREVADFFISFGYAINAMGKKQMRTKVHHSQADKLQEWDGIAIDKLVNWILNEARLQKKVSRSDTYEQNVLVEEQTLYLGDTMPANGDNVVQMTFSDVQVQETNPLKDSMMEQTENTLHIETELTIREESLEQTFERAPYSIEIFLTDMSTGQSKLAKTYFGVLSPGQLVYPISQEIDIPETGHYQLLTFARLLPPFIGIAQAQGPLIRVEA